MTSAGMPEILLLRRAGSVGRCFFFIVSRLKANYERQLTREGADFSLSGGGKRGNLVTLEENQQWMRVWETLVGR